MNQVIKVTENNERKIDELGRIVIPITIRERLQIHENDYLEICESGKNITLKKVENYLGEKLINNFKITLDNKIEVNIDIKPITRKIPERTNRKATVRAVDQLGRIIIPKELRDRLRIKDKEAMKICEKDNMIILIKKEYEDNNRRKFNSSSNRKRDKRAS